jgi:hypothetical protein
MSFTRFCIAFILFAAPFAQIGSAQISKGHQILIDRGFQILGLTQPDNYFHSDTYSNAGYTTISFSTDSTGNLGPISTFTGEAPGLPWARWAPNESNMPGDGSGQTGNGDVYSRTNEIPHLSQLVEIQLADEWNLNDDTVRTRLVDWFNAVRNDWPNSILYHNNWGYQLTDAALSDYINRAHPDMINFDTYPWESVWDVNAPNHIGPVIPGPGSFQLKQWYSELRQYREYARAAGIPMGIYRHVWHGVQDYDQHVYRDPSFSELRLNTFGAIAFSVKFLNDFYYNTSAGSLFTKIYNGSGDTQTNANGLYAQMGEVNRQVRNWGNTLVRLTPITAEGIPGYTTSMMFIRGKNSSGNLTTIPDGFQGDLDDGGGNATYTDWVYQRNDPYLTNNWSVTNMGAKNNGHASDVIVSWFKSLDESFDGPDHTNEIYMMVVNGLTDPTGTAADCLQEIKLNFHSSLAAVEMLNPLAGVTELQLLPLTNGLRQLVLNLNGGEAALFKFSDGAPFVGSPLPPVTGIPVITIHPTSRANVLGANSTFTTRALGSAPLSYQWQFEGANIAGATTNNYTRANVQLADAGNYTVIVSNSFGTVTSTIANLTINSSQPFFYEPFDYSNIGGPVSSNTPANWTFGGTGTNDLNITSGSLSYPGLQSSIGNSVTNGGVGLGVRRLFGTNINSGTIYFSALFRMNNLGYGTWTAAGTATQVGALMATDNTTARLAIMIKSNSPTGYIIGVQKGGTGVTPTFDTTTEHYTNETIFLLGKYDFTTTPNSVSLWINPSSSTFGAASPPISGFISATTGTDGLTIDRFNMRQNTATSVPAAMQWDELRIGNTWAEATPLQTTFSTSLTSLGQSGDGTFQFTYTNSSGQSGSIYASTNLTNWISIGTGTQISPGMFQFIDSTATNYPRRFYQLRSP